MSISIQNILNEIINDKGKKYLDNNVDLFIFVLKEEYNSFVGVYENHSAEWYDFVEKINRTSFDVIYLCVWDMENQKYTIDNPILIKIKLIKETSACKVDIVNGDINE